MGRAMFTLLLLASFAMLTLADEPGREKPFDREADKRPTAEVSLLHATSTLNLETGEAQRTFIVQADLNIPADSDAVGMSHQIELTELKDGEGRDMLAAWRKTGQIIFGGPRHYGSLTGQRQPGGAGAIPLSTSINGLPYIPARFSVVRGTANVLLATRRVERVLSPISQGAIIELTPSLAVQLVQIKQEGNNVQLQFEYDAEQPAPFFNPNGQPPFVDAVLLIDDQGAQVAGHGGAPQQENARAGLFEGQGHLVFNLAEGRSPASLKFNVVVEMEEYEVEFLARDIQMPIEP